MNKAAQAMNNHIENYLNYYCNLSYSPGFAVLLKGQWGSGKTWFIDRYREKLGKNYKFLYVSLYGMTTFSEIEDALFQQLHPLLASKEMTILAKISRGLLKGTLKIDLNNDKKEDGTLNVQLPEINLPEYLKNVDKSILIFDDIERCKIDLNNLLGYINFFVEHQDLKAILVANEKELTKYPGYQVIKEKLIGKTFGVSLDFEGALEHFITIVHCRTVQDFLSNNSGAIQELYDKADYKNLRILKQVFLDLERICKALPEILNEPEILQNLLKLLIAFSIEIKRGRMFPKDIKKLQDEYLSKITKLTVRQPSSPVAKDSQEELSSLREVLEKYASLNLYAPFPSSLWWETFFDEGIVNTEELGQSIVDSKDFQAKNRSTWVRLWHFLELSDNEFDILISELEREYQNRHYTDVNVIRHICGLLLIFSDGKVYNKTKIQIFEESKLYIDYLKDNNKIGLDNFDNGSYKNLGFLGSEFAEFKELSSYINRIEQVVREEKIPSLVDYLLNVMSNDIWKFYNSICRGGFQNGDTLTPEYYDLPIFKYIEPSVFVETLLSISCESQRIVFDGLYKRYTYKQVNPRLVEELDCLQSIKNLLQAEVSKKRGKLSGFILDSLIINSLNEVIEKFDNKDEIIVD